jgi:hypothetical protein
LHFSYVAKYTACAGPAPKPAALTPLYNPRAVANASDAATHRPVADAPADAPLVVATDPITVDPAACSLVLIVSTGNIAVCSTAPASAPDAMCA